MKDTFGPNSLLKHALLVTGHRVISGDTRRSNKYSDSRGNDETGAVTKTSQNPNPVLQKTRLFPFRPISSSPQFRRRPGNHCRWGDPSTERKSLRGGLNNGTLCSGIDNKNRELKRQLGSLPPGQNYCYIFEKPVLGAKT